MDALFHSAYTWVTLAFIIFVFILVKVDVHGLIAKALDQRSEKIKAQLEEARKLHEDAKALLGKYQRRQRDAQKEAEDMIAQSREEAEILTKQAEENLEAAMKRQERIAEEKISQAEAKAVSEVKAAAAQVALAAAQKLMAEHLGKKAEDALLDKAVGELKDRLH